MSVRDRIRLHESYMNGGEMVVRDHVLKFVRGVGAGVGGDKDVGGGIASEAEGSWRRVQQSVKCLRRRGLWAGLSSGRGTAVSEDAEAAILPRKAAGAVSTEGHKPRPAYRKGIVI